MSEYKMWVIVQQTKVDKGEPTRMERFLPHIVLMGMQFLLAGAIVIARAAFVKGMNGFVFVAYRHVIAALAVAPFAILLEKSSRPPLTWPVLFKAFLLGCGLAFSQNFYFQGVYYTSSMFGSAALNLLPVATMFFAALLGMEKFSMEKARGRAKLVGMMICIGGAVVMGFYKGPCINIVNEKSETTDYSSSPHRMAVGCAMLLGSTSIWAACIVFQGRVLKTYGAQLTLTTLICLMGAITSAAIAVVSQHNNSRVWALGWNVQLLSILYSGVIGSALGIFVQGWIVRKKGPVFVAVFSPFCMIVTAVLELIIFHVNPTSGSLVGALVLAVGLYAVLWGKAKDEEQCCKTTPTAKGPSSHSHPNNNSNDSTRRGGDILLNQLEV